MKESFRSAILAVAAIAIAGFAGCSKDNNGDRGPEGRKSDEKSFAQLVISTGNSGLTRAADENSDPASTEESTINVSGTGDLKVFVFDADDVFDSAYELELTANTPSGTDPVTYTSDPFQVTRGEMTFFIFANDISGLITAPTIGMTVDAFRELAVAAYGADTDIDIATNDQFLMGTLWQGTTATINSTGTIDSPQNIPMSIGRLASKITLASADPLNTNLPGVFSGTTYRLGTVARTINTVGVFEGSLLPYNPNSDVVVNSYLHNIPAAISATLDAAYLDYTSYKSPDSGEFFYATENTTARSGAYNQQFYGNTTYIQIRTVFTPSSIYSPDDPATPISPVATGTSFWTAAYNGILMFFNGDPTGKPGVDNDSIVYYTDGVMYYKFPVFDPGEEDAVIRNRVLRNHSYTFTVNIVRDLGTPTEPVDPTEPIIENGTVDITVTVLNWDKVTGSVDL